AWKQKAENEESSIPEVVSTVDGLEISNLILQRDAKLAKTSANFDVAVPESFRKAGKIVVSCRFAYSKRGEYRVDNSAEIKTYVLDEKSGSIQHSANIYFDARPFE